LAEKHFLRFGAWVFQIPKEHLGRTAAALAKLVRRKHFLIFAAEISQT
jgi:hypothetical protein